ncbi:MAG: AAA family ATPase, partial [Desulfobacterales bacterium]
MYEAFFGLKAKPFQISTDPKFMWMGEKHQEALATLKYGILDSKGFLLLTGDVGTGKTTLLQSLLNTLDDNVLYALVPNPGLEPVDFFNFIARAFHMKKNHFNSKGAFLEAFDQFLKVAHNARKKVLLIIDEAQAIQPAMLEEIRLLSNIEKQYTKLLNIFFVGQNEFNELLVKRQMRALRQRITLNYHVDPLNRSETAAYIRHRLNVAGTTTEIFAPSAMDEVIDFAKGYPRLINVICDHALLTGFVQEIRVIDGAIIRECAKELAIAVPTEHKEAHNEARKEARKMEAAQQVATQSASEDLPEPKDRPLPDNPMKTQIPKGTAPLPPPPQRTPPSKA